MSLRLLASDFFLRVPKALGWYFMLAFYKLLVAAAEIANWCFCC